MMITWRMREPGIVGTRIRSQAEDEMTQDPGITVSGVGTAAGTPDVAMIDCGVEVHAGSADRATAEAADAAHRVLAALRDEGLGEEAVRTSSHTVEPQMDHSGDRPVVTGYRVSTIFTARLEDYRALGRDHRRGDCRRR